MLDKPTLKTALQTAFDSSKTNNWTTAQVAQAIADAIDAYVRAAEVKNVKVSLDTGNQTGSGKLE